MSTSGFPRRPLLFIGAALALFPSPGFATDPILLVLNKHEDTMAMVNPSTLKVLTKIPAGHDPHEMVVTPDGRFAYVSNYAAPGNTVSVIDLVGKKLMTQVRTDPYTRIHGAAISPDGKHVYFTAGQTGYVVEIDTQTNTVRRAIPTTGKISHMVLVSPDGTRIYTANIVSRSVSVIDRATGELIAQVPCDAGCEGMAFTPDGKHFWAANQNAGNITVIDLATNKAVKTFSCPGVPLRIHFAAEGRIALVSSWEAKGSLVVLDVPTCQELHRIALGNQPIGIEVAPDESRAFVSNMTSDEIHVVDMKQWKVVDRFQPGKGVDAMLWWYPPK